MIKVGVNENIVLSKATINDKGTLVISARERDAEVSEKKELTAAEMLSDSSDTTGDGSTGEINLLIFRPQVKEFDDPEKDLEPAKILEGFILLKNQLTHWLVRFTTNKNIKWAPFAGIPINAASTEEVLAAVADPIKFESIYQNYIKDFIRQVAPFLNLGDKPSRLFLVRKSVTSHFGVLRKRFLDNQPFWEANEIPVEQSKMYTKLVKEGKDKTTQYYEGVDVNGVIYVPKFSNYELEKGLDNPDKIDTASDDTSSSAAGDIEAVEGLFNANGGTPEFTLPIGDE